MRVNGKFSVRFGPNKELEALSLNFVQAQQYYSIIILNILDSQLPLFAEIFSAQIIDFVADKIIYFAQPHIDTSGEGQKNETKNSDKFSPFEAILSTFQLLKTKS